MNFQSASNDPLCQVSVKSVSHNLWNL
jgi:hypothetical protein